MITVSDLIAELNKYPKEAVIMCQVYGEHDGLEGDMLDIEYDDENFNGDKFVTLCAEQD